MSIFHVNNIQETMKVLCKKLCFRKRFYSENLPNFIQTESDNTAIIFILFYVKY